MGSVHIVHKLTMLVVEKSAVENIEVRYFFFENQALSVYNAWLANGADHEAFLETIRVEYL